LDHPDFWRNAYYICSGYRPTNSAIQSRGDPPSWTWLAAHLAVFRWRAKIRRAFPFACRCQWLASGDSARRVQKWSLLRLCPFS
jgi:hypothetical protein